MSWTPVRDLFERLEIIERLEAARRELEPGGDGSEVADVLIASALEQLHLELEREQWRA